MAKSNLTIELERAIIKETAKWFGCLEVTIGWYGKGRVDYMTMDCKEIFRCYELKVSKQDFKSSHGHNFVGHFNYYVMPSNVFKEVMDLIPKHIGIYTWNGRYLTLIKRPKKQELKVDINILKNSMIRSLNRDATKFYNSKNGDYLNRLSCEIRRLQKENESLKRDNTALSNELYFSKKNR